MRREIKPASFQGVLYIKKKTSTFNTMLIFHTDDFLCTSNSNMELKNWGENNFYSIHSIFFLEVKGKTPKSFKTLTVFFYCKPIFLNFLFN